MRFIIFIYFLVGTGGRIVGISSLQQIIIETGLPKKLIKHWKLVGTGKLLRWPVVCFTIVDKYKCRDTEKNKIYVTKGPKEMMNAYLKNSSVVDFLEAYFNIRIHVKR